MYLPELTLSCGDTNFELFIQLSKTASLVELSPISPSNPWKTFNMLLYLRVGKYFIFRGTACQTLSAGLSITESYTRRVLIVAEPNIKLAVTADVYSLASSYITQLQFPNDGTSAPPRSMSVLINALIRDGGQSQ